MSRQQRAASVKRPVAIELDEVCVDIAGEYGLERILDGVSLTAAAGTVHAVIGESGSGKSTILRAISGALPPTAALSGQLTLIAGDPAVAGDQVRLGLGAANEGTAGANGRRSRRSRSLLAPTSPLAGRVIGTVPQSAATALTPVRTFGAQLAETCAQLQAGQTAAELISAVGLAPRDAALYPFELSGGMAQRAAVALAMAGDPPVLVADEPTSALDPDLTVSLLHMLRTHADGGGTVVLVTHDLESLEDAGIADEITVMHGGRVIENGPAAQVLGTPRHPYTRLLLDALPSRGLRAPTVEQVRAALGEEALS